MSRFTNGRFAFLVLVAALGWASKSAAVMVAPHALFIDHRERSGVFYIHNPGTSDVEIEIDLKFGYPASGDDGLVRVKLLDRPAPDHPSAAGWIKAFPRRLTLGPNERQAVRLLAQPPANLPDGEYWTRILVTSQEAQAPTEIDSKGSVQAGLNLATRTITALMYRKGEVRTAPLLYSFEAEATDTQILADITLDRLGNAAYLGRLVYELTDAEGELVQSWKRYVAIYFEQYRRSKLDLESIPPGEYELTLRLTTDRDDLDESVVLAAEPIVQSLRVTIPPVSEGR